MTARVCWYDNKNTFDFNLGCRTRRTKVVKYHCWALRNLNRQVFRSLIGYSRAFESQGRETSFHFVKSCHDAGELPKNLEPYEKTFSHSAGVRFDNLAAATQCRCASLSPDLSSFCPTLRRAGPWPAWRRNDSE